MKTKSITISLLAIIFTLSVFANQSRPSETKGTKLVEQASKAWRANDAYSINFTMEIENPTQKTKDTNKGLLVTSGNRYYMEVAGSIFVSDGTTTWAYSKQMNEVQIDLQENNPDNPTPTSIINDFEKKFKAKHIRQETHKGKKVEIIDLLPTARTFAYHKIRVAIDTKTKMIVYLILHDREGGTTRFEFDKVEANPTIPRDRFRFNPSKYPGIEVVDLR